MRKNNSIYVALLIAVAFSSCDINKLDISDNTEEVILEESGKYIQFGSDVINESRGTAIPEGAITQAFDVFGYKYEHSNNWDKGYEAVAKPNVFYLSDLNGNNTDLDEPVKVEYENGIYTYNNPQQWDGKYSFFAYAPSKKAGELTDNYAVSGTSVQGTPYIDYTMDLSNPANHKDLVTGYILNTSVGRGGTDVILNLYHRLSAMEVSAYNFYTVDYIGKDGVTYKNAPVTIEITGLEVAYKNLTYNKSRIYLNRDKEIEIGEEKYIGQIPTSESFDGSATYAIVTTDDSYDVINNWDDNKKRRLSEEQECILFFVPQPYTPDNDGDFENDLQVKTTGVYKKYYLDASNNNEKVYLTRWDDSDNDGKVDTDSGETVHYIDKTVYFNRSIDETCRYDIQLTFTSEAVTINLVTSNQWVDDDAKYEFM